MFCLSASQIGFLYKSDMIVIRSCYKFGLVGYQKIVEENSRRIKKIGKCNDKKVMCRWNKIR